MDDELTRTLKNASNTTLDSSERERERERER
jgi:hypothetical protein